MKRARSFLFPLVGLLIGLAGVPGAHAASPKEASRPTFESRISEWKSRYGAAAPLRLLELARDKAKPEAQRYFAVLAATRLGGHGVTSFLPALLKDRSWLIRSAALQSVLALQARHLGPEVLNLLKDPALVIRSAAVEAVQRLRPTGASRALASAAVDPKNFHRGKPQWVPQKALRALQDLSDKSSAPVLRSLLTEKQDPELLALALETLDRLHQHTPSPGQTLRERLAEWKKKLGG